MSYPWRMPGPNQGSTAEAQRLETAAFLHSNVKMVFVDEVSGKRTVYRHDNGNRDNDNLTPP